VADNGAHWKGKKEMTEKERAANLAAEFMPMNPDPETGSLPAVKVAGCLVFAYVKDGLLRVSVDLDDASEYWPGECTPMRLSVQGNPVFEADEDGNETPAHVHCGLEGHTDPGEDDTRQTAYIVRTNCEYSRRVLAGSEDEAIEIANRTDLADWDQAWAVAEAEADEYTG
jgi:hypothetical protein